MQQHGEGAGVFFGIQNVGLVHAVPPCGKDARMPQEGLVGKRGAGIGEVLAIFGHEAERMVVLIHKINACALGEGCAQMRKARPRCGDVRIKRIPGAMRAFRYEPQQLLARCELASIAVADVDLAPAVTDAEIGLGITLFNIEYDYGRGFHGLDLKRELGNRVYAVVNDL